MEKSLYSIRMELWKESYSRWISHEILTFPWFFDIAFLIVLYIIWIKLVDKKRLKDFLLLGALLSVGSVLIDTIAVSIGLWDYKIRIFPLSPAPFPFDYTVVPIFYMLVMQYTSTWKSYLIGAFIAAAAFAFIVEPIYIGIGIKHFYHFNYVYMFLLVLIVTVIMKVIYNWIDGIQRKHTNT